MKRIKAYAAFVNLSPYIEPLLSKKNMNYPLAFSMSGSRAACFEASLRLQNLGTKDTIAELLESVVPNR